MNDTKPVTLEDGTPVPEDLREMYDKANAYGVAQYKGGDWPQDWSHEKLVELIEDVARAEAREKRLREALEAIIRHQLTIGGSIAENGSVVKVARAALNDKEEGTMSSESAEDKLQRIRAWCDAYPLEFFEEPDMQEIRTRLGDKLLSELSAHNFRHVLRGISAIIGEDKEEGQ